MSNCADVSKTERFIGRVKWFNNKAGYGFVTITDGSKSGSDVFVHHSSIKVDSEQYKYLIQGEYIEFILLETKNEKHEFQAGEVCGIKGGKLMCETRRDLRSARTQYKTIKSPHEENEVAIKLINNETLVPRSVKVPRVRGSGPRDEPEWKQVSKVQKPKSSIQRSKNNV